MKFIKQKIQGVYLIKPEPFSDKRGMLRRNFCKKEFKAKKLMSNILQSNISENKKKYTLRGFHFQNFPYGENKVISCLSGQIYDIVVDLRKKSKTYLKWQSFIITDDNRLSLYVPSGCANAYITLKDNTWLLYYHSQYYKNNFEDSIRYNDPYFKFKWPKKPRVISKKDLNILDFNIKNKK